MIFCILFHSTFLKSGSNLNCSGFAENCIFLILSNKPVPIMASLSSTCVDALMWTPSVLGLSAGAVTVIPETATCSQLVKAMCICWLFSKVTPLTFKLLHLWKVTACITTIDRDQSPTYREMKWQKWKSTNRGRMCAGLRKNTDNKFQKTFPFAQERKRTLLLCDCEKYDKRRLFVHWIHSSCMTEPTISAPSRQLLHFLRLWGASLHGNTAIYVHPNQSRPRDFGVQQLYQKPIIVYFI